MISILHLLSATYIVMFLFFLVVFLFIPKKIGRAWYIMGALAIACVAFCGYHFTPSARLDVYRLSKIITTMRNSSQNLSKALFTAEDDYGGLYFFRLLCYLISRTSSNHWLTVVSIVLTMGQLYFVLIDYLRSEKYTTAAILPSLMLIFMGMQMPYVFSGIRNTIAVASAVTAIYLVFYKKKYQIIALLLGVVAATTHQMVFILLPTLCVGCIKKHQWMYRIIALCSMPIIFGFAALMQKLSLGFVQQFSERILDYSDNAYGADRPEMLANIMVFCAVSISHFLLGLEGAYQNDTVLQKGYWNAYCFLGCAMIGCSVRRDFTLRIGYIMGIAAVPIISRMLFGFSNWEWKNRNYKTLMIILVFGCLICCAKVYYDCWYTMSRWNFSIISH